MGQVSFECGRDELITIHKITRRAARLAERVGIYDLDYMQLEMDITAAHCNGNPLDLDRLLLADDTNFGHDVFGIRKYIDRSTGKIGECFVPRYSKRE